MDNRELVVSRVLTAVVAEARRMAAEGVATREDIDKAMTNGALFKKPPFVYTEEVGAEAMDARLKEYAARFGKQFE
jgi:3-hydroxyacyl-CoA dehydrogenase